MNHWPELQHTLNRIQCLLGRLGLQYHITGGLVSSFYGDPRFTQDVDLVIRLSGDPEETDDLIAALAGTYIIDPDDISRAIGRQDMFQVLDAENLIKIDLHVGEAIPGELDRSIWDEIIPGVTVPIVCKTDAILAKLLWIAKGSHKSRQDVVSMMRNPEPVDWEALRKRAADLNVGELLEELCRAAGL